MARVYRAIQQGFERPVALKVIAPELAANKTFGSRFIREAKIVGRLSHAHIVPVFDVGEHNGVFYLAMELLSGGDLGDRMRAKMDEESAIGIIQQLARALGYAHQEGFIHRDVKPDNVLFRDASTAVLTDFGIARSAEDSKDQTQITQVRSIMGSPKYMSPEQSLGHKLDARTDLYSLGIMLYQMLTGQVPYSGRNLTEISLQRFEHQLPELPPSLQHLQAFNARLLAYDRDDRFSSCEEVLQALAELPPRTVTAGLRSDTDPNATIAMEMAETDATATAKVTARASGARLRLGVLVVALMAVLVLFATNRWPQDLGMTPPGTSPAEQEIANSTGIQNQTGLNDAEKGNHSTASEPFAEPRLNTSSVALPPVASTPPETTLVTPTPVEFFAFTEAVSSPNADDQGRFLQNYPTSVLADIIRAKTSNDPDLVENLTTQARNNDPRAQLILSELYDTGWGVAQDRNLALHFSTQAAKSSAPFAQYQHAMLMLASDATDEQRSLGILALENSAQQGFFLAQTVLGNYYFDGKILGRDVDKSMHLLELAGAQGDRNALFNLGRIHDGGTGLVPASPARAKDYFKRAAELGHPDAESFLQSP